MTRMGRGFPNSVYINPEVFVELPVPKNECVDKITPFGIFNFFFDDEVVDYIVKMTNLYATREK